MRMKQADEPITKDEAQIRGFTLLFDDSQLEMKFNVSRIKHRIAVVSRYSFAAACFQGLFYWGDVLEFSGGSLVHIASIRLILGVSCLLVSFLVSTGLLIPTQVVLWYMNICYGVPTLALFYFAKTTVSQWDCLFLIYGLSFFILPKMSPLNFIFGFSGALTLSILFIYISAYRLSLQQWLLSNIILSLITAMFCYISYSYERGSRERWLLRERLQRERINFRIISSSVQDDINRTVNDDRPFPLDPMYSQSGYNALGYRDRGGPIMRYFGSSFSSFKSALIRATRLRMKVKSSENVASMNSDSSSLLGDSETSETSKPIVITKEERLTLFFRGLGAWVLCFGMGYAFDIEEINRSAAFALLVHSMGFSVFLMVFTGQVRWLALNGIVALSMLWIFNQTGMDNRWVVFSTHTVGYVVLFVVIVVMILVFGGVVLVWSHLIEFLKEVLVRYPQVKDDLNSAQDKILEQVLIKYISDLPKSNSVFASAGGGEGKVLELYKEAAQDTDGWNVYSRNAPDVSVSSFAPHALPHLLPLKKGSKKAVTPELKSCGPAVTAGPKVAASTPAVSSTRNAAGAKAKTKDDVERDAVSDVRPVQQPRRPGCCYFCLKPEQAILLPACRAWEVTDLRSVASDVASGKAVLPMCTPYTGMIQERDEAVSHRHVLELEAASLRDRSRALETESKEATSRADALKRRLFELEATMMKQAEASESRLKEERRLSNEHVLSVISQHNHQLSELKRLHKALLAQSSAAAAAAAKTATANPEKPSISDDSRVQSQVVSKQTGSAQKTQHQQQPQQQQPQGRAGSHDVTPRHKGLGGGHGKIANLSSSSSSSGNVGNIGSVAKSTGSLAADSPGASVTYGRQQTSFDIRDETLGRQRNVGGFNADLPSAASRPFLSPSSSASSLPHSNRDYRPLSPNASLITAAAGEAGEAIEDQSVSFPDALKELTRILSTRLRYPEPCYHAPSELPRGGDSVSGGGESIDERDFEELSHLIHNSHDSGSTF